METTILIAKVLGVYFLLSGVFVVTHRKTLALLLNELFKSRAMTFVVGAILVLGGAIIVFAIESGTGTWIETFVKVMGWAILLKGVMYVLAPEKLHKMVKLWSRTTLSLMGVTTAAVGVYLVFFLV